jgi:general secretion pathway protein D
VDPPTNSIIAIAANPTSLDIVADMIEKLDKLDPEASDILVYELKYADAVEVADQINNLLSDGAVTRPSQSQAPNQTAQSGATTTGSTNTYAYTNRRDREIIYPWQSTQAVQQRSLLERPINRMIGNVRIVPDTRSNQILVTAQPAYLGPLKRILESLDQPEPQVHIATRMVEITRGNDRRIGIRWTPDPKSIDPAELENAFLGLGRLGFLDARGSNVIPPTTVTSETSAASDFGGLKRTVTTNLPGGNAIFGADMNLALLIQLLMKNTDGRILSEPSLTVNNNELGNIFVGSEFPFRVNSQITDQGGSTVGIEYRKVGINLDIVPHINTEGEVDMRIALENSKIREGETVDGQIIKDQRMFNTQVAVASGETMVIGGILLEDESRIERGLPILGSIPLLKYIFGKSDKTKTVRELLVFITPEIINAPEDSRRLLNRSLDLMDRMDGLKRGESIFPPIERPEPGMDSSRMELILEPEDGAVAQSPSDIEIIAPSEGDEALPAAPTPTEP